MRFLVIGCGSIGERHIKNLKSLDVAEIYACEQDKEKLECIKDKYEIEGFLDYEAAFSNEAIDAVLVCTSTSAHIPPALAAIHQGCHVFVEKPISHTLEGVDNLIEEAKRKNLILMTGFNMRFHPNLQQIKQLLDRKTIGSPISARAHFGCYFLYRLPYHPGKSYRQDYAAMKTGGGVILDAATHIIDYLRWFFGEVEEVFCYSGKMSSLDLEAEDFAEILLKFKKGTIASLHVDFIQQPYQNKCEIIGEQGTIIWSYVDEKVRLFSASNQWQETEIESEPDDMYLEEMKHFIKCVRGEETAVVDGVSGKRVLEVALAAKESAQIGKVITLRRS